MPVAKLLDTNICIYIARSHPATVGRRFTRAAPGSLGISIITWGELCFGAAKSNDPGRAHSLLELRARGRRSPLAAGGGRPALWRPQCHASEGRQTHRQ